MTNILDEYIDTTMKYRKEYGMKTIVLYQCGSFYELYSIDNNIIDLKSISELFNISVTRRNKSIIEISKSNPLLMGFPLYMKQKYIKILTENNYTAVIIDQLIDNKKITRKIVDIISPGTSIDNIQLNETNNIMCIYFENIQNYKSNNFILSIGISIIDISSGNSIVYEIIPKSNNETYVFNELYRIITFYNPKELILFGNLTKDIIDTIYSSIDFESWYIHNKINNFSSDILNLSYQIKVLEKIFPNYGLYNVIEYIDLERKPLAFELESLDFDLD